MRQQNKRFYFNLLSIAYLLVHFFLVPNFFSKSLNFVSISWVELVYVIVSALFSIFTLVIVNNFLNTFKLNNFQRPKSLVNIRINFLNILAIASWLIIIIWQIFRSISGLLFVQKVNNVFLTTKFLNYLFIAQFTISIYLLFFFVSLFIIGFLVAKSKTLNIEFVEFNSNFENLLSFQTQKKLSTWTLKTQILTIRWLLFASGFFKKVFFDLLLACLSIKALKSAELRRVKKQITPPNFVCNLKQIERKN